MENIITEITRILKDYNNLIEIELALDAYLPRVFSELVSMALERVDREVTQQHKGQGYEIDSTAKRTVQFSFGPVELKRRRMRKKGMPSVIPLDQTIGLPPYVRYSPLMELKAAQLASDSVYRKAAEAIELLAPVTISHSKVHSMAQNVGESLQKWTDEAPLHDQTSQQDKKNVPVLFIEGDGVLLKGPEEKRPELHRVQIHEGVEEDGKRPKLKNSKMFESTMSSQKAFERASRWLEVEYDLRKTIVVSNSDGGSGYEKEKFEQIIGRCARHEHFRDPYHVNQKIKQRMSFDKQMEHLMVKAVRKHDRDAVGMVLDTTLSRWTKDEKYDEYKEQLDLLENYLDRNWESIQPLKQRDLPVEKGIGICESSHRPFSYRMKHQGRGFKVKGAGNLAAIISARKNGTFLTALTTELPAFEQTVTPEFKGAVRAALRKAKTKPSYGIVFGGIANYGPSSSPIGQLEKMFK